MTGILVSIVTIAYNAQTSIENTIQSVISQQYPHIEYIIIDGASTDNTLGIVNKYKKNIDIIISEKDRGISDAFNKGIRCAHGDLIMFLNAGDTVVDENIVNKVVSDWEQNKSDILFYKVKIGEHTFQPTDNYGDNGNKIWDECHIPHQGAFVRREVFDMVGNFNICLKTRMDYDFWARCRNMKCSYLYIPEAIVEYEVGGTSMQISNAKCFYQEGLGIKLIYGLRISLIDIVQLLMPQFIRRIIRNFISR